MVPFSCIVAAILLLALSSNIVVAGFTFPAKNVDAAAEKPESVAAPHFNSHAPASILLGTALLFLPLQSSHAVDASVFTNDYGDPLHPLCERHIQVSKDVKTFHYSGTAVGPKNDPVLRGCSPEEIRKFGLQQGAFDGVILSNNKISAGDGIHEGKWEPANTATTKLGYEDVDGIRWNDGNKWFVLTNK